MTHINVRHNTITSMATAAHNINISVVNFLETTATAYKIHMPFQLADPGTKPACDATTRGTIWRDDGGTGVADTIEVCAKNSSNTYAWYAMATIP
jgi:hypothetical protein